MSTDQWNASLYDNKHSFVSQYGNDLVEFLAPNAEERVLDLGCGTGDLTQRIHELNAIVTGVDQSANMIAEAKQKYPMIDFSVEDALHLHYRNEFDAVFSNATLHWIKEPEQVLRGIHQSLKAEGRFVAEFGGYGNVQHITDEIIYQLKRHDVAYREAQFPWYFPSVGEYTPLMEKAGFRVLFAQHFDRPTPLQGEDGLRNWIEMFGKTIFTDVADDVKESIITEVLHHLKGKLYRDGTWIADYKRLRVIGVKE